MMAIVMPSNYLNRKCNNLKKSFLIEITKYFELQKTINKYYY